MEPNGPLGREVNQCPVSFSANRSVLMLWDMWLQDFQDTRMSSLMSVLTSVPRAAQLLDKEPGQMVLVNSLEQEFRRYLRQVHRHTFKQDKRY